jgi:hypothetical protein
VDELAAVDPERRLTVELRRPFLDAGELTELRPQRLVHASSE